MSDLIESTDTSPILTVNNVVTEPSVGLKLTKDQAQKLYGLLAFAFKEYQDGTGKIGEHTIMKLIPISEALAIQIDKMNGLNSDISFISSEALIMAGFECPASSL